jgi:hypothetical protein
MPVSVACDCGKAFRVPDEHRGKRIKCPGCGEPLSVPGRAAPGADPDAVLRFRCECGKLLQAKAESAGKLARCSACGAKQEIPETSQEEDRAPARGRVQAEPPRAKRPPAEEPDEDAPPRRRRRDDEEEDENPDRRGRNGIQRESDRGRKAAGRAADEDARPRRRDDDEEDAPRRRRDEEDPDDRPRKRRKKQVQRSVLPLVLVAVFGGVLLLGGGGLAVYLLVGRGGPSMAEADFLPPDAHAIVTVRWAELQKFEPVRKAVAANKNFDELVNVLGLPQTDIERVDVVFHDITTPEPVMSIVVVTSKPYDRNKVMTSFLNPRTITHEGKTFHIGKINRAAQAGPQIPRMPGAAAVPGQAMFQNGEEARFMASRTVLVVATDEATMRRALTSAVRKNATGPLAAAVKQATGQRHLFAAVALPTSVQAQAKNQIGMVGPPFNEFVTSLVETTGGTLAMDFGETVQIDLTVKYPDDKKAAAANSSVEKMLTAAGLLMAAGNNPFQELLKALKVEQRGSDLLARMTIPRQSWEQLQKLGEGGGGMMAPPAQARPPVRQPGRRRGR